MCVCQNENKVCVCIYMRQHVDEVTTQIGVCRRMQTDADGYRRMLTDADGC
jgi:hypothetical protein